MSRTRIAAVIAKELREYRRNRFLVGTMIVYPAIFTVLPIATVDGHGGRCVKR